MGEITCIFVTMEYLSLYAGDPHVPKTKRRPPQKKTPIPGEEKILSKYNLPLFIALPDELVDFDRLLKGAQDASEGGFDIDKWLILIAWHVIRIPVESAHVGIVAKNSDSIWMYAKERIKDLSGLLFKNIGIMFKYLESARTDGVVDWEIDPCIASTCAKNMTTNFFEEFIETGMIFSNVAPPEPKEFKAGQLVWHITSHDATYGTLPNGLEEKWYILDDDNFFDSNDDKEVYLPKYVVKDGERQKTEDGKYMGVLRRRKLFKIDSFDGDMVKLVGKDAPVSVSTLRHREKASDEEQNDKDGENDTYKRSIAFHEERSGYKIDEPVDENGLNHTQHVRLNLDWEIWRQRKRNYTNGNIAIRDKDNEVLRLGDEHRSNIRSWVKAISPTLSGTYLEDTNKGKIPVGEVTYESLGGGILLNEEEKDDNYKTYGDAIYSTAEVYTIYVKTCIDCHVIWMKNRGLNCNEKEMCEAIHERDVENRQRWLRDLIENYIACLINFREDPWPRMDEDGTSRHPNMFSHNIDLIIPWIDHVLLSQYDIDAFNWVEIFLRDGRVYVDPKWYTDNTFTVLDRIKHIRNIISPFIWLREGDKFVKAEYPNRTLKSIWLESPDRAYCFDCNMSKIGDVHICESCQTPFEDCKKLQEHECAAMLKGEDDKKTDR